MKFWVEANRSGPQVQLTPPVPPARTGPQVPTSPPAPPANNISPSVRVNPFVPEPPSAHGRIIGGSTGLGAPRRSGSADQRPRWESGSIGTAPEGDAPAASQKAACRRRRLWINRPVRGRLRTNRRFCRHDASQTTPYSHLAGGLPLMTCSCFAQEAPYSASSRAISPPPLCLRAHLALCLRRHLAGAAAMPYAPPSAPESGAAFPCPTSLLAPGPHQESPCPGRAMNTSPMAAIVDRRQA